MNRLVPVALLALLLLSSLSLRAGGDLAVFGLRPGMARSQVIGILGPPARDIAGPEGGRILGWRLGVRGQDDPRIWLDRNQRLTLVVGSRLRRDGQALLERGATPQQLQAALGTEATVEQDPEGATVCYYPRLELRAVMAGNPPRVLVFGLGRLPAEKMTGGAAGTARPG